MSVPLVLLGLPERKPDHNAWVAVYPDRGIVVGDGKVSTLTGAQG